MSDTPAGNAQSTQVIYTNIPVWVKLIEKFGFPTAISILLLAALLGWIPSPLLSKMHSIEYQAWQTNMLLRAICYEMTKDNTVPNASIHRCEPWKPMPE